MPDAPEPGPARAAGATACAACGVAFTCGMRSGTGACWCASLPGLDPVAGRDCLCRACLERELAAQALR